MSFSPSAAPSAPPAVIIPSTVTDAPSPSASDNPSRRNVWLMMQSDIPINNNRKLADRLCAEHPDISTDAQIYGGNPHIKNVRLTVGNILAKLYIYGDVKSVANMYAPHVTESQIKEAIAYAQDFLEEAIHEEG